MVSVIICSRDKQRLQQVSENVTATIGVPFEIIAIDNSRGQYSIFQAYNIGVATSKGNYLCFMHEDIVLKTPDWGQEVQTIFEANPTLGLLGVAGSTYKTKMPSHWSFPDSISKTTYANIVQHYNKSERIVHHFNNPRQKELAPVVAVDGVWFCTKREVFDKVAFDDKTYSNFHCYDVDFSLSVYQHYGVAVTFKILIEHLSEGNFSKAWLAETLKLHKKWDKVLPINLEGLTEHQQYLEEKKALSFFVKMMAINNYLVSSILSVVWSGNSIRKFGLPRIIGMNISAFKRVLRA